MKNEATFWMAVSGMIGAFVGVARNMMKEPVESVVAILAGVAVSVYIGSAVQDYFHLSDAVGRGLGFICGVTGMGLVKELLNKPLVQLIAIWRKEQPP
jgi:hypothetical protein